MFIGLTIAVVVVGGGVQCVGRDVVGTRSV